MDGRVQIVDQLRADGGLCENQLNRGERVVCVVVKHRKECVVSLGRLKAFFAAHELEEQMEDDGMVQHLRRIEQSLRQQHHIEETLQEQLDRAVANEEYETAAKLRDEMRKRGC